MTKDQQAAKKVVERIKPTPLGKLIDDIWALREKKRALAAQVEELEAKIAEQEAVVIERMDNEHLDKSTGKMASVSVTETANGTISDFDKFWEFAKKNNYGHLFQRRVTDTACRELWEQGKKIPGVDRYIKRRLNIRTLT